MIFSAFLLVLYTAQMLRSVRQSPPNYFEEYTVDSQLLMGQILSKGALQRVHLVVIIYIPCIIPFFFFLGPLIPVLQVPIIALTSIFSSVIQYHTGMFVGAIERSELLFTPPYGTTNSILKVSQRHPIDRIIYHFIAFGQLVLFVGWNVWIFLFILLLDGIAEKKGDVYPLLIKVILYPQVVTVLIYTWIITATGRLGEIRWWPSRDCLSRLVPPLIKNTILTKCQWSLFSSILRTLTNSPLVIQQQVHCLDSSRTSPHIGINRSPILVVSMGVIVAIFIYNGLLSSEDNLNPAKVVEVNIIFLSLLVPGAILIPLIVSIWEIDFTVFLGFSSP